MRLALFLVLVCCSAASAIGPGYMVRPAPPVPDRDKDGFLTVAGLIRKLQALPPSSRVAIGSGVSTHPPWYIAEPAHCALSDLVFIDCRWSVENASLGSFSEEANPDRMVSVFSSSVSGAGIDSTRLRLDGISDTKQQPEAQP